MICTTELVVNDRNIAISTSTGSTIVAKEISVAYITIAGSFIAESPSIIEYNANPVHLLANIVNDKRTRPAKSGLNLNPKYIERIHSLIRRTAKDNLGLNIPIVKNAIPASNPTL